MSTSSTQKTKTKGTKMIEKACAMVADAAVVGFDLETTGLDPRRSAVRLVQLSDGEKAYVIDARSADEGRLRELLAKLAARDRTIAPTVAHGADFEYRFVYYHYGVELDNLTDTMLLAQLLNAGDMAKGASLGVVAERYLGVTLDKEMQGSDWTADKLTERQLRYAARDALVLPRLYRRLAGEVDERGLAAAAEIELAALPAVARMKLEGIPVDKAAWDAQADEVEARRHELEREILEAKWLPGREPVPQVWALQGEDCLAMMKKAGFTDLEGTTAKDLKPYVGDEFVDALLAYRKMPKGEAKEIARELVLALAEARGAQKPSLPAPPWNFGSPHQVNEICMEILGFYLESTDEAHLLLYTSRHPFFSHLLEYRRMSKLAGTYGRDWFKEAYDPGIGRVYPGYRQIGTSTGRFASGEREKSPNAQNLPSDYRRFFVAPRGRVFVNVDYSQIEVRIIAKMLEVEELLRLFTEGEDIYANTSANLLGIAVEEVTKEQRQLAKALVLGMIYGLSAHGLPMYAFNNFGIKGMTPEDASAYVRAFYNLYPEIEAYHNDVLGDLDIEDEVDQRTLTGRLRAGITNRNEAINAPVQGTAADGMKAAMAAVYKRLRERFGEGAFISTTLHDELLIEVDEEDGLAALEVVERTMIDTMDELLNREAPYVPVEVEGKVSKVWTKG